MGIGRRTDGDGVDVVSLDELFQRGGDDGTQRIAGLVGRFAPDVERG